MIIDHPLVYFECLDYLPSLYKSFFMQKILIIYQMATILNRRSLSIALKRCEKVLTKNLEVDVESWSGVSEDRSHGEEEDGFYSDVFYLA